MQPAQTPAGKLATAFGDLDAMSALYHDDVVWTLPASMTESGGPFATMAPFAGKAAVCQFNEVINAAYDATTVRVVISDELEQGGLSVARFTYSAAMIPQGEVYEGEYLLLVRTQNGLIIEVREFVDTWRVMKARGQA
jgi:ketosteroid isomerase-like protein